MTDNPPFKIESSLKTLGKTIQSVSDDLQNLLGLSVEQEQEQEQVDTEQSLL